jgi:hypothetical protein
MTDDDQLLDADAVANLYSVSRGTVWRWWQAGRIPAPVKQRPMFTPISGGWMLRRGWRRQREHLPVCVAGADEAA